MLVSILVGIPYHISDDIFYLYYTIDSVKQKLGRDADIIIATDEGTPRLNVPAGGKVYQTWVKGHGVGKARNAITKFALDNKYDCVIFMDGHMEILTDNIASLCKSKLSQPKIVVMEKPGEGALDFMKYFVKPRPRYELYTLGSFLDKMTWKWAYIYSTTTFRTVMTTEPCYSVSRDVIEALYQAQGEYTLAHYWGKESFDATVSAARLGYDIEIRPDVVIGHIYKVGSPSWASRFKNDVCENEPFCGVLHGSVYQNGILWGDCVYALKHYTAEEIEKLPVVKDVCNLVQQYDREAVQKIMQFNLVARYTLDDVYKRLNVYLMNASWNFVR